jgi:hypothetical protein
MAGAEPAQCGIHGCTADGKPTCAAAAELECKVNLIQVVNNTILIHAKLMCGTVVFVRGAAVGTGLAATMHLLCPAVFYSMQHCLSLFSEPSCRFTVPLTPSRPLQSTNPNPV